MLFAPLSRRSSQKEHETSASQRSVLKRRLRLGAEHRDSIRIDEVGTGVSHAPRPQSPGNGHAW